MSKYSVPHGICVTEGADYAPGAATVAEFQDTSRDRLLWEIEDLRAVAAENGAVIDETFATLRRIRDGAQALIESINNCEPVVILSQSEFDARIADAAAAAQPKRRKRG